MSQKTFRRTIGFLLFLVMVLCPAAAQSNEATPTDLVPDRLVERQVHIDYLQEPTFYGQEVTLISKLINFSPQDRYTYQWQYSLDQEEWFDIEGATGDTYTFIIDKNNWYYYWRLVVDVLDTPKQIDEYEVPLGTSLLINHIGDCFD